MPRFTVVGKVIATQCNTAAVSRCGKPFWCGCAEAAGKKVIRLSLTCLCGLTANREGLLARPFFDFYQSLNSSDRQQYQLATLAYGRQGIAIR